MRTIDCETCLWYNLAKRRKGRSQMSVKCSNCGASVTDESKFCNYCGAKIEDNIQKIEVSGTVNQNITHRFSFNTEAKLRKIEAKKELEDEKARAQIKFEEERRKTIEALHAKSKHDDKVMLILFGVAGAIILLLLLLGK